MWGASVWGQMPVRVNVRGGWRTALVASVVALGLSQGTRAGADTIMMSTSSPEVALNGVNVSYDAGSGYLSITGTPYLYSAASAADTTARSSTAGFTPSGTFSLEAWLDPADGSLNRGTVSMGSSGKAGTESLLTGALTNFGFLRDGPIFFQFAFNVSGGSLAGTFGSAGGATIDAGSETFDGSYLHAFSGEGTGSLSKSSPSVAAVPLPAALPAGLALFAGTGVLRAVRRRRRRRLLDVQI
jgi:hypothetical protein